MRRAVLLALAIALPIAGCGSSDDKAKPAAGTTPPKQVAAGQQLVKGTGYSIEVPKSWRDDRRELARSAVRFDLAYVNPKGVIPHQNIVVIRENPPGVKDSQLGQVNTIFRRQAGGLANSAGVSPSQDRLLDGAKAKTYGYIVAQGDGKARQRQVFSIHKGAVYTITWTAPTKSFASTVPLFEKILASWRWT